MMKRKDLTRRQWLKTSAAIGATALAGRFADMTVAAAAEPKPKAIEMGSRLELFVDDFLIGRLAGAELKAHQPEPKDVALVCDAPWEGNTSAYYCFIQDDDLYRVYYRGSHFDEEKKKGAHPEVACYAQSRDGLTWEKPKLGICEYEGSKQNNIVWSDAATHNFTVFKDGNPACSPDARYKALGRGLGTLDGKKKTWLNAYKSPDGLHWSLLREGVITAGAFDSQNLAFWDGVRGEYRAYWRIFTNRVRAIRTATSKDFLTWENQADLTYGDAPDEHLYTNAIAPYARAPHLFLGFPTRYQPKTQQVEPIFMSSRDAVTFHRWPEALIPITAPKDRDGNRSNYMAYGILQLPGRPRELSVYATEAYYKGPASRVRRFTFRTDGFVSVHAAGQGELLTKPLCFSGKALEVNYQAGAGGSLAVELQGTNGKPITGFSLADCMPLTGDEIAARVKWKAGESLQTLAGKPVRVRFVLKNADLYAIQFPS